MFIIEGIDGGVYMIGNQDMLLEQKGGTQDGDDAGHEGRSRDKGMSYYVFPRQN